MNNDFGVFNPNGADLSRREDIWLYDPAGSPRQIPNGRPVGLADLLLTRIEGAPGWAERLVRMFGHCILPRTKEVAALVGCH
jgi:hypothetical protein